MTEEANTSTNQLRLSLRPPLLGDYLGRPSRYPLVSSGLLPAMGRNSWTRNRLLTTAGDDLGIDFPGPASAPEGG